VIASSFLSTTTSFTLCRFYAASQPRLPAFSSKQLAATLAALGSLSPPDASPPPAWSAAALAAVSARLATLNAPGLCEVMWGLCELRLVPERELVQRWVCSVQCSWFVLNGCVLRCGRCRKKSLCRGRYAVSGQLCFLSVWFYDVNSLGFMV
jgi:hypothetical protein